jgi:transketolase N-terminal domain/subunit
VQAGREEEEGFVVKDNDRRITHIEALTKKALWLSNWMIHHANHIRPNVDGVKVGGHQASSASMAAIMSALYFGVLRPEDRVAVKPHAAPVFHAIQYLLGKQTLEKLIDFRAFGGAQSYPSRTKDADDVDFSTGSVGLGVAFTAFASLIQDYVRAKTWADTTRPEGRMVALVGDAELDEGNVYECLLEGWKHGLRNTWWVIDYNRQSLDGVVREGLYDRIEAIFRAFDWNVVTLKYGALQRAAFAEPGETESLDRRRPQRALFRPDVPRWCGMARAPFRRDRRSGSGRCPSGKAQRPGAGGVDGQPRWTLCPEPLGTVRGRARRQAHRVYRLHRQGLGNPACRPQGQPCRPDDISADRAAAPVDERPRGT